MQLIDRYFKYLRKHYDLSITYRLKEERVSRIKYSIIEFFDINKWWCVTVLQMIKHINYEVYKDNQNNKFNYYDIYSSSKNEMNFGWRNLLKDFQDDTMNGLEKLEK